MDQVIIFNKSYEQRFQEYMDILSGYDSLPVSQIKKQWSFYLELVIDPDGWQAIWKIHKLTCEKLKIPHPTVVLVYVDSVIFQELTAFVKILAVQDDIHLPATYTVPLIHLWPTKQQDDSVSLNMPATANALDTVRFFYNHLWMPWDVDEDDNVDWISKHLEERLRFHFDVKMGVIPKHTADHFRLLLTESKLLQAKREQLEEELADEEDIDVDLNGSVKQDEPSVNVQTLMEIHLRLTQLRNEIEILENPFLRNVLIKKTTEKTQIVKNKPNYWLIFSSCTISEYLEYLNKIKVVVPENIKFQRATSAQNALDFASQNDIVILGSGRHRIRYTGGLEDGGAIIGIPEDAEETIIDSTNDDIMLDFSAENALLENITIDAALVQCAIMVRKGCLKLRNCFISGTAGSTIHQGIIVLDGSELILENCTLSKFCTGIIANATSKIIVNNCTISNVDIALKLSDDCTVNITDCKISNNREYGIYIETDKTEKQVVGDLPLLESMSNILVTNTVLEANERANVIIEQKFEVIPVRNLFSNPSFNTILSKTQPEEMMEGEQDVDMASANNSI